MLWHVFRLGSVARIPCIGSWTASAVVTHRLLRHDRTIPVVITGDDRYRPGTLNPRVFKWYLRSHHSSISGFPHSISAEFEIVLLICWHFLKANVFIIIIIGYTLELVPPLAQLPLHPFFPPTPLPLTMGETPGWTFYWVSVCMINGNSTSVCAVLCCCSNQYSVA